MEEIRQHLAPLTDWLPDSIRPLVRVEVWWLVELVVLLLALLLAGLILRTTLRGLWLAVFPQRPHVWDAGLREPLDQVPQLPANASASLRVYHVPARLRLVVVAPIGKHAVLDPEAVPLLLERAIPGLGPAIQHDRPEIRVWPPQLSTMGFTNSFHRCTPTGRREDEASEWVLLAGRARGGGQALFVGLGLWADAPTHLGRRNLEPEEWLDVLRLNRAGA